MSVTCRNRSRAAKNSREKKRKDRGKRRDEGDQVVSSRLATLTAGVKMLRLAGT